MIETVEFKPNPVWTCDVTFEYELRRNKFKKTVRTSLTDPDSFKISDYKKVALMRSVWSKSAKFVRVVKIENQVKWTG